MGGSTSYSKSGSRSSSKPVLLPEQKRIWDFLTQQLIPQALGKETAATQIATQRARDEGANILNMQQQQINQLATQGFGSAQRARLVSEAQNNALQNTLQNILAQRQAAQMQGFQLLQGLPIQPSQQSKSKSSAIGIETAGGVFGGSGGGTNATTGS